MCMRWSYHQLSACTESTLPINYYKTLKKHSSCDTIPLMMCYRTTADLLSSLALTATQLSRSAFSTQSTRNRHSVSLSHAFLKEKQNIRGRKLFCWQKFLIERRLMTDDWATFLLIASCLLTKIYDGTPIDDWQLNNILVNWFIDRNRCGSWSVHTNSGSKAKMLIKKEKYAEILTSWTFFFDC